MRILLLGGSKSGKSMLGQRLTRQLADGGPMIYWATLEPRDTEDRAIVRRHLAERDGWGFGTLERGRALPEGLALVLSDRHPGGFDSRYFGLVPMASLRKVEPIFLIGLKGE